MTFKQRIQAMYSKDSPGSTSDYHCGYSDAIKDAAQLAAEADALMAEMAEAITAYATAKTESQAREAQTKLLKVYGEVRGKYMAHTVRLSQFEAMKKERDQLAAQVERLSGQLRAFRKWIEKQEVDAFGVVEETHDCPAYPIRDELIYEITKTINETPDQAFREIRAEAVEEAIKQAPKNWIDGIYEHVAVEDLEYYAEKLRGLHD